MHISWPAVNQANNTKKTINNTILLGKNNPVDDVYDSILAQDVCFQDLGIVNEYMSILLADLETLTMDRFCHAQS